MMACAERAPGLDLDGHHIGGNGAAMRGRMDEEAAGMDRPPPLLAQAPNVAVRISAPYKFVSKEFKKERSQVRIGNVEFGGDEFIVMAGPCSVESEKQIMETAEAVAAAGAKVLRGGAYKPRTSPYAIRAYLRRTCNPPTLGKRRSVPSAATQLGCETT